MTTSFAQQPQAPKQRRSMSFRAKRGICFFTLPGSFICDVAKDGLVRTGQEPRIVHVGFIVWNQARVERFSKYIPGFRPGWNGGMKDDETDWVSLQVPDGTDWVEFMVNASLDADEPAPGIMNHIALGGPDIHAPYKQILMNGMQLTEEPRIVRHCKWQLNPYHPEQTCVELMEFTPVEKPCCSEYTGPHPKP